MTEGPTELAAALAAKLTAGAQVLGLDLSTTLQTQLLNYLGLIAKWNKVYNLTSVRDPAEMLTHHLLDSLAIIPALRRHLQAQLPDLLANNTPIRVLDVGSGAGLPGTVLAIVCPELDVTCVDTVAKKAAFIQNSAITLKLPNLRGVHARVEELQAKPFDLVTSRAFSSLVDFVTLTRLHVKQPSGVWLAMKGKHPADELAALPVDVGVFHVEPLEVPGLGAERCLVWMRKIGP
jgi:16S rRNA (guanine527-N7)-methyltransferase